MAASSHIPYLSCAIAHLRRQQGLTGPEMQRRLGSTAPAAFYRTEGRVELTEHGRRWHPAPAGLTVERLGRIADALGEPVELLFYLARELEDEDRETAARQRGEEPDG